MKINLTEPEIHCRIMRESRGISHVSSQLESGKVCPYRANPLKSKEKTKRMTGEKPTLVAFDKNPTLHQTCKIANKFEYCLDDMYKANNRPVDYNNCKRETGQKMDTLQ